MKFVKVCHITTVHSRNDTRIFIKECSSLASAGYDVALVVADGLGDETRKDVKIVDVGKIAGRVKRILFSRFLAYRKGVELDADIYHLHDPELIPAGVALKRRGKRVIFDSHEDIPKQILGKHYLHPAARGALSRVYGLYESRACRIFDGVIAATPFIRDKFLPINSMTVDVNNYPLQGELVSDIPGKKSGGNEICYVGSISAIRGIREIVKSLEIAGDVRLNLAGNFVDAGLEEEVRGYPGWAKVNYIGYAGRDDVRRILSSSRAGLVTLHSAVNYLDSLPVKMFEYMSASLPVIASNFPLWREIVEGNRCGLCVDPCSPEEIAAAIRRLLSDDGEAQELGRNGREAMEKKYNWGTEEKKLLSIYSGILADS